MSLPRRRLIWGTVACGMLLTAPSFGQQISPPSDSGTATTQHAARYRRLQTLQCVLTRQAGEVKTRVLVYFRAPNDLRLTVFHAGMMSEFVTDPRQGMEEVARKAGLLDSPLLKLLAQGGEADLVSSEIGSDDGLLRRATTRDFTETYTAVRSDVVIPTTVFTESPHSVPKISATDIPVAREARTTTTAEKEPALQQYDLGRIDPVVAGEATHDFIFANNSGSSLTITRLSASCGCVSTMVGEGKPPVPNGPLASLRPGEQTVIRTRVNISSLHPGKMFKSVIVYSSESKSPVARLSLTGDVIPVITPTPIVVDFQNVPRGTLATRTITINFDERLLVGKSMLPQLSGTGLAIDVSRPTELPAPRKGIKSLRYTVSLKESIPLGRLNGSLTFVTAGKTEPGQSATMTSRSTTLLRSFFLPVMGNVTSRTTPVTSLPNTGSR